MTQHEINIAIAKSLGWHNIHEFSKKGELVGTLGNQRPTYLPDYCNDLNKMHEAEKILNSGQWDIFTSNLLNTVRGKGPHPRDISAVHASAKQRAEALLKTIGKWKEPIVCKYCGKHIKEGKAIIKKPRAMGKSTEPSTTDGPYCSEVCSSKNKETE